MDSKRVVQHVLYPNYKRLQSIQSTHTSKSSKNIISKMVENIKNKIGIILKLH